MDDRCSSAQACNAVFDQIRGDLGDLKAAVRSIDVLLRGNGASGLRSQVDQCERRVTNLETQTASMVFVSKMIMVIVVSLPVGALVVYGVRHLLGG